LHGCAVGGGRVGRVLHGYALAQDRRGPNHANVASQDADDQSLLNLYRKLIRLRAAHPALGVGDFTLIPTDPPQVYAYLRRVDGEE